MKLPAIVAVASVAAKSENVIQNEDHILFAIGVHKQQSTQLTEPSDCRLGACSRDDCDSHCYKCSLGGWFPTKGQQLQEHLGTTIDSATFNRCQCEGDAARTLQFDNAWTGPFGLDTRYGGKKGWALFHAAVYSDATDLDSVVSNVNGGTHYGVQINEDDKQAVEAYCQNVARCATSGRNWDNDKLVQYYSDDSINSHPHTFSVPGQSSEVNLVLNAAYVVDAIGVLCPAPEAPVARTAGILKSCMATVPGRRNMPSIDEEVEEVDATSVHPFRCCNADIGKQPKMKNYPDLQPGYCSGFEKTYDDAVQTCINKGLQLCTEDQFRKLVTKYYTALCGRGCGFDTRKTWVMM